MHLPLPSRREAAAGPGIPVGVHMCKKICCPATFDHGDQDPVAAIIDLVDATDPERAHAELDRILICYASTEVREAARRLMDRARWWAVA